MSYLIVDLHIFCVNCATMSLPNDSPTEQISRVAVKPPPFWKNNPALWFIQLESQFALADIKEDLTKYNYVVAAIDSEALNSVSDIILNPPAENKYDCLKNRLIDVHSESESAKLQKLLQGLDLGDQRPSQLLTRMRALAGKNVGETLLKSLWLNRLSTSTQTVLAALNDDLSVLAPVADKIHELSAPISISNVKTASISTNSDLEQKIADLTKQVNELTTLVRRQHNRSRSRNKYARGRSFSPSSRNQNKDYCYYHKRFGSKARKCCSPCTFGQSEN